MNKEKFEELELKRLGTPTEMLTDVKGHKTTPNQQQTSQDQLVESVEQARLKKVKFVKLVFQFMGIVGIIFFVAIVSQLIHWLR